MKILIINQHIQDVVGGSEAQCDLIAKYLTQFGHEVIYFAIHGQQQAYAAPYRVEAGPLTWRELRRIVSTHQPDIVYWRFNKRRLLPSVLCLKWLGRKVVFAISHINDVKKWSHKVRYDASSARSRVRFWVRVLRPAISSRINHLGLALVAGVVAQLHDQFAQISARRSCVIPNSVEMPNTQAAFQWPRPFVVWIANIKPAKNPELFLELARKLEPRGVDCLMIGRIQTGEYASLLHSATLPANFSYLGVKPPAQVHGILQAALFLAHTCEPEGFPNIFIQAWMHGKPTVSLFYDPDKMIQTQRLGYCSGKFEQFVQDVHTLVQDEELRNAMGARARAYAHAHFLPEPNIRALERFLQSFCAKGDRDVQ